MHGDNGKLNILRCAGEALASGKAYQIVDKFFLTHIGGIYGSDFQKIRAG